MADNDEKLFDVRLVDHHIRHGTITAEAYRKHLESLPDDMEHAAVSEVRFPGTEEASKAES